MLGIFDKYIISIMMNRKSLKLWQQACLQTFLDSNSTDEGKEVGKISAHNIAQIQLLSNCTLKGYCLQFVSRGKTAECS